MADPPQHAPDAHPPRRRGAAMPRANTLTVLAVSTAVLLLSALASTSRIGRVLTIHGDPPSIRVSVPTRDQPTQAVRTATPKPFGQPDPALAWVTDVLRILFFAGLALLVGWFLYRMIGALSLRHRARAHAAIEGDAIETPTIDEVEVQQHLRASIDKLRLGGSVDEVIIECWAQLEDLAEASGIERRPSQTSTEFTYDILRSTAVDRGDLQQLAELYRQAMFSIDDPSDGDRIVAIRCLESLAAALDEPVTVDA